MTYYMHVQVCIVFALAYLSAYQVLSTEQTVFYLLSRSTLSQSCFFFFVAMFDT